MKIQCCFSMCNISSTCRRLRDFCFRFIFRLYFWLPSYILKSSNKTSFSKLALVLRDVPIKKADNTSNGFNTVYLRYFCHTLSFQAVFLNVLYKSLKSDPSLHRVKVNINPVVSLVVCLYVSTVFRFVRVVTVDWDTKYFEKLKNTLRSW